jgi:membrane protease YdiL (CAAX protease family)
LRPKIRSGWPYWLTGWLGPAVLTILGAGLFFLLFSQYFDAGLTQLTDMLAQSGLPATVSPWLIVASQVVLGILIAPVVNGLFTFGEEFGWRGYLQPKLMPVGVRKTFVLMGLIWGVWHWPIIAMGHNYGLDYPGVPWLGLLGMVWFAFVTGTFLGWISWRGGSVWPAVIGHGALNGIANLGVLFVQGQPNPLLGPLPVGVIASIPWTIVALWILFSPRALAVSGSQHAAVPLGSSSG